MAGSNEMHKKVISSTCLRTITGNADPKFIGHNEAMTGKNEYTIMNIQ